MVVAWTSIHDRYLGNEGLQEVLLQREKGPATIMVLKLEFPGR